MNNDDATVHRVAGGLYGVAVGDALGATLEFMAPEAVRDAFPEKHCEIVGGGAFGWRPGQGTDDSDLTFAVLEAIEMGTGSDHVISLAADAMLAWFEKGPRDVGNTTAAALRRYRDTRNPRTCGSGEGERGNGSLMRTLPVGLSRLDRSQRAREAAAVSRITHADSECVDACVAYCEIVAALVEGESAAGAVEHGLAAARVQAVRDAIERGAMHPLSAALASGTVPQVHGNRGYVLDSLAIAVSALVDERSSEAILVDVVNLGGDADTTGAIAGGLLGVRDGRAAWPHRWTDQLEYRHRIERVSPVIAGIRLGRPTVQPDRRSSEFGRS